eukprot:scaffold115021_cov16-Tisochrysis_lutea.AAC.1
MQAKWYASQITALCMKGSLPSRTRYERAHLSNTGEGLRKGEGWDGCPKLKGYKVTMRFDLRVPKAKKREGEVRCRQTIYTSIK